MRSFDDLDGIDSEIDTLMIEFKLLDCSIPEKDVRWGTWSGNLGVERKRLCSRLRTKSSTSSPMSKGFGAEINSNTN